MEGLLNIPVTPAAIVAAIAILWFRVGRQERDHKEASGRYESLAREVRGELVAMNTTIAGMQKAMLIRSLRDDRDDNGDAHKNR